MLITYSNYEEVLVCDLSKEKELIKEYFTLGSRNLEDYNRNEHASGIVSSVNKMHVNLN